MAKDASRTTADHDEIRRWVEERGGTPAEVASTAREGEPGILRIDFPGFSGEGKLRAIDWDTWFEKFDRDGLALVYQETTADGQRSNFNELVSRETASPPSRKPAARRGARTAARREAARTTGPKEGKAKRGAAGTRGGKKAAARRGTAKKGRSPRAR